MTADFRNGMPGMAHSGAARAGMANLTATAAYEWAHAGVRVNAVAPGWVASSGMDTYNDAMKAVIRTLPAHVPLRRLAEEAEVSAAIVFLLSPGAAFISGVTLQIDGAASLGSEIFPLPRNSKVGAVPRLPSRGHARGAAVRQRQEGPLNAGAALPHRQPPALASRPTPSAWRPGWPRCARWKPRSSPNPTASAPASSKRGQLSPRERVARLIDRDSSFMELSSLAGLGMHDDDGKKTVMGGGSIVGIGCVAGKRVLVSASDSGIKGGTVAPMGLRKALRAQAIALENKLPLVYLVESGGANLMYQSEMFVEGGRSFANQARLSAAGIPQIAVVHGSSTAGGAYLPGLSDYVVLVRGRSSIYLAGPPLVKAAIGEGRHRRRTRRRATACRGHRPGRIPHRERCPCHRHRARSGRHAAVGRGAAAAGGARAAVPHRRADGHRARRRRASPTTCAR